MSTSNLEPSDESDSEIFLDEIPTIGGGEKASLDIAAIIREIPPVGCLAPPHDQGEIVWIRWEDVYDPGDLVLDVGRAWMVYLAYLREGLSWSAADHAEMKVYLVIRRYYRLASFRLLAPNTHQLYRAANLQEENFTRAVGHLLTTLYPSYEVIVFWALHRRVSPAVAEGVRRARRAEDTDREIGKGEVTTNGTDNLTRQSQSLGVGSYFTEIPEHLRILRTPSVMRGHPLLNQPTRAYLAFQPDHTQHSPSLSSSKTPPRADQVVTNTEEDQIMTDAPIGQVQPTTEELLDRAMTDASTIECQTITGQQPSDQLMTDAPGHGYSADWAFSNAINALGIDEDEPEIKDGQEIYTDESERDEKEATVIRRFNPPSPTAGTKKWEEDSTTTEDILALHEGVLNSPFVISAIFGRVVKLQREVRRIATVQHNERVAREKQRSAILFEIQDQRAEQRRTYRQVNAKLEECQEKLEALSLGHSQPTNPLSQPGTTLTSATPETDHGPY